MSYVIIGVIGAIAGFFGGKALTGNRHGSGLDGLWGAIGGFVAFLSAVRYYPPAVEGWPLTIVVVVAGALALLFILRLIIVRKPPAAARGRFY